MEIFVVWVVLSVLVGVVWRNRGHGFAGGLIFSLILSPIVGIAIGLLKKPDQARLERAALSSGGMKKCPYCAELIKSEARVCRFCSRDLSGGLLPASGEDGPDKR
jgi:hypothetical protein